MLKLGVNIDHIATLRQARREFDPDPVKAAQICLKSGADSIVAHLREDRRHIQDKDIVILRKVAKGRFNLEMSIHPAIVKIALEIKPDQITLVPERRQEITTEGGLDVIRHFSRIKQLVSIFLKKGIAVSLFVAPVAEQILKAHKTKVPIIELHTGLYSQAKTMSQRKREWNRLNKATQLARELELIVNAGHGLNYENTKAVARIKGMNELNIGHSIISRAVFVGLESAVEEMKKIIND